jgi:hypothetical protein
MIGRFSRASQAARRSALLLAVLALLLRAIIPAGVMLDPSRTAQGLSPVVLCTGHGPVTAWVDGNGEIVKSDHSKKAPGSDRHPDHPCAFASMAAPLYAPLGAAVLAAPAAVHVAAEPLYRVDLVALRLVAAPPPQTGPPTFN